MKNLFIIIALVLIFGSSLHSESYHFVANDPYYKVPVKIDSINVYYMNTGKDTTVVSSSVHLETVTTVELNNDYSDVRLYPNPTNDILNIEFVSNNLSRTTITIVDLEGRKLYSQSEQFGIGKHNFNLNIAGLNQGLYFISIGSSTHKFSKIGGGNGSEISLTQTYLPTLIKENSTQSQFDYRFTIYCEGFKPKYYYSKRMERDTIIVDMTSLPTGFDGTRIKVTLNVVGLVLNYLNRQHNWHDISRVEVINYKDTFIDTLVIRNGIINLTKYYEKSTYGDRFDKRILTFEIDTLNQTFSNLLYLNQHDKWYERGDEDHHDTFKSQFNLTDNSKYNLDNGLVFLFHFDDLPSSYYYNKEESYNIFCPGHYETWSMETYDPINSYIKIEFID